MAVRRHHRRCISALPSPEPGSRESPGRNVAIEQLSDVWGLFLRFLERGALLPPHSEGTTSDRQFRVIGKSGPDNPGKSALSGTSVLGCHTKNRDAWFRVWACLLKKPSGGDQKGQL